MVKFREMAVSGKGGEGNGGMGGVTEDEVERNGSVREGNRKGTAVWEKMKMLN